MVAGAARAEEVASKVTRAEKNIADVEEGT
jgi:hypothetical protein